LAGPPSSLFRETTEMPIKNQIDHRLDYAKQKAEGRITDATAGRHGRGRPAARRPKVLRPKRPAPGEVLSLADKLGIDIPDKDRVPLGKQAEPLTPLVPPATANVPETAEPPVEVDPLVGDGELAPVGFDRAIESNRPVAEVDAEQAADSVRGAAANAVTVDEAEETAEFPRPWGTPVEVPEVNVDPDTTGVDTQDDEPEEEQEPDLL